jgi:hypothetical protein
MFSPKFKTLWDCNQGEFDCKCLCDDGCVQMPGVNLPVSQIWYYMLTLLICGILHEVGHAIAAVR